MNSQSTNEVWLNTDTREVRKQPPSTLVATNLSPFYEEQYQPENPGPHQHTHDSQSTLSSAVAMVIPQKSHFIFVCKYATDAMSESQLTDKHPHYLNPIFPSSLVSNHPILHVSHRHCPYLPPLLPHISRACISNINQTMYFPCSSCIDHQTILSRVYSLQDLVIAGGLNHSHNPSTEPSTGHPGQKIKCSHSVVGTPACHIMLFVLSPQNKDGEIDGMGTRHLPTPRTRAWTFISTT